MPDNIRLKIQVTPLLREFIIAVYGSDIIRLTKTDFLAQKVKVLLERPQSAPQQPSGTGNFIYLDIKDFYIGSRRINAGSCNYLSPAAQSTIEKELDNLFMEIFKNYMAGYIRGRCYDIKCQKDGVEDFFNMYDLSMSDTIYNRMIKSWDRSGQKKRAAAKTLINRKMIPAYRKATTLLKDDQ